MIRAYTADTYESLSAQAADLIEARIRENPATVLGLATGSTPIGMYRELIRRCKAGLSFQKVTTINLDEYDGASESSPHGYRYFMNEKLLDHIDIEKRNTFVPRGDTGDAAAECAHYDALIDAHGGIGVQVLGIGHDGHIGFNEPGDAFIPQTHRVALTQETIDANARFFDDPDQVPRYALTMGMRAILQAKEILMLVAGPDKAAVLEAALHGPITPAMPASILQLHPNMTVIYTADRCK